VRSLIEPSLVERFIAQATDAHMAQLKQCIDNEEAARQAGDMRRAIRLSGEFHSLIAEGAKHETLARILRELTSRTSLVLMSYSPAHEYARMDATSCGCNEHRALLDAIRLRDAKEAAKRMREHLARLQSQLQFNTADEAVPDLNALFGAPV